MYKSPHRSVNASLPSQTRDNGSLYAHIFIYQVGAHPFENQYVSRAVAPLTVYSLPQDESINLLSEQKSKEVSLKRKYTLYQGTKKFNFSADRP